MQLKIKRINKTLPLPTKIPETAGYNIYSRNRVVIKPKQIKLVSTNLVIKVPLGYFLLIANRSSTPMSKGLIMANGIGVADPFYCGDKDELMMEFLNITDKPVVIDKGEKLAQVIIVKYETVTWNEVEAMGEKGFGGYRLVNGKPAID